MTFRTRIYLKTKRLKRELHAKIALDVVFSMMNRQIIAETPLPPYPMGGKGSGGLAIVGKFENEEMYLARVKYHAETVSQDETLYNSSLSLAREMGRFEKQQAITSGVIETATSTMKHYTDFSAQLDKLRESILKHKSQ